MHLIHSFTLWMDQMDVIRGSGFLLTIVALYSLQFFTSFHQDQASRMLYTL